MESYVSKLKTLGYIITIPAVLSLAVYFYNERVELLKNEIAVIKERLENQKLLQCDGLLNILKAKDEFYTNQKKQFQLEMDKTVKRYESSQKNLKKQHALEIIKLIVSINQLNAQVNDLNELKKKLNISGETKNLPYNELKEFSKVFGRIKKDYIEPISDSKLLEDVIRGMLSGLEPRKAYRDRQNKH